MSESVLAVPLSRLFAVSPPPPAGPTEAERMDAALAAGRSEGRAEAEAVLLPRLAALEAALAQAEAERHAAAGVQARLAETAIAALEGALAEAVTTLGLGIARAVLTAEPAVQPATLARLVADALAGLAAGDGGTLRMNPGDAPLAPALPAGWALVADPGLGAGQVVAERGPALSGAGLSMRLEQLATALEGGL